MHDNILILFHEQPSNLVHGSITRVGGVSSAPFSSNNLSFGVGDEPKNVQNNRKLVKKQLGLDYLVSAHQVHGEKIHCVADTTEDYEIRGYDALITNEKGVGLLVQHADCQAVLIYDPENAVIAAVHNGWRGSVINIVAKTITEMMAIYGSRPEELNVAIGPSLGPCCAEFVNHKQELPPLFQGYQVRENYFDFWQITEQQLIECEVGKERICVAGICTSCSHDHYSYRRAIRNGNGVTGRNGTLIALV